MQVVSRVSTAALPTRFGVFQIHVYGTRDGQEHAALTVGTVATESSAEPVLVRPHSECLTGDVFGSARCDCGEQLAYSLDLIQRQGRGILLYLRQEGRGIGLANKIRAYALQEQGLDTVDANRALGLPDDMRDYRIAAAMLHDLDALRVVLLTNNPAKVDGLTRYGISVVGRLPIAITPNSTNIAYLRAKRERMGHLLEALGER